MAEAQAAPSDHAFEPQAIQAVYRAIFERRDMRHFSGGEAPAAQLRRLLNAAHHAPSVGFMQPWRFVRVFDRGLRAELHQLVEQERVLTARALGAREGEFMKLKVEGILEAAEVLVVALPPGREQHVFGRRTLPRMGMASAACAIQNLWLAARAEGIGMDWVSLFDPEQLAVRRLSGRDPALYVQNLRDPEEVKGDTAATALAKEMQTRYLHSQRIAAQQREGYSGTLQVLKAVQFLWGWQVTAPGTVRPDHWQSMHDVYVRDRYRLGTRGWLEGENRAAFAQTLERMLEAVRLEYWRPDPATRRELLRAYDEAVKATGLRESNPAVRRFAQEQAAVGQAMRAPGSLPAAAATVAAATPPAAGVPLAPGAVAVRGLRLQPQVVAPPRTPPQSKTGVVHRLAALWAVACLLAVGAWRQTRRWRAVDCRRAAAQGARP